MRRIMIKQSRASQERETTLAQCPVVMLRLDNGETIKRGCGLYGLETVDIGWRCVYCGNFIYGSDLRIQELWLHFKTGREYWRPLHVNGRDFVNGIPVSGYIDDLPGRLLSDLKEIRPPRWFAYYLISSEQEFNQYLERY